MLIVEVLRTHAKNGRWMTANDLKDAVEMMVSAFLNRIRKLRINHCRPGYKYCAGFTRRHRALICLKKPNKQEAKRFLATNATTLTTHFRCIERLIADHNMDPSRIVNLDESGLSADNDNIRREESSGPCRKQRQHPPTQALLASTA